MTLCLLTSTSEELFREDTTRPFSLVNLFSLNYIQFLYCKYGQVHGRRNRQWKSCTIRWGKNTQSFLSCVFFFTLEQCRKYFKVILKIDVNDVFSTTLLLTLNRFRMLLCCVHRWLWTSKRRSNAWVLTVLKVFM